MEMHLKRSRFDYVALGHIHKRRLSSSKGWRHMRALEPTDKNDTGKHGFYPWRDPGRRRGGFLLYHVCKAGNICILALNVDQNDDGAEA